MKNMKKLNKISLNTLLLLVDIPLLLLLTKNLYTNTIIIYIQIRVLMLFFIPLIMIFKAMKTTVIAVKKSRLFSSVSSVLSSEKDISDVLHIAKNSLCIPIFYMECLILISLFMYSTDKAKYIFASSNNLAILLATISLSILLIPIRFYINKRCDSIINM